MSDENKQPETKELVVSKIRLVASIDPEDVVNGLNNNDESLLAFICQMIALSQSSYLRERLTEVLGAWSEEDWVSPP